MIKNKWYLINKLIKQLNIINLVQEGSKLHSNFLVNPSGKVKQFNLLNSLRAKFLEGLLHELSWY